ncbi:MAG: F-box protein [Chlamydiales bacterium]|nr:F-box protein [Chlamydiales bacterium]
MLNPIRQFLPNRGSNIENFNKNDYISKIDENVLQKIFSYLDLKDLSSALRVSRRWNRLIPSDQLLHPTRFFPSLKTFESVDWMTHFGLSVKHPPRNVKTILFLKDLFFKRDLGKYGEFTLLTIPKKISLKKLSRSNFSETSLKQIKRLDLKSKKCYRVLITNLPLNETFNKTYEEQVEVLKEKGFQMPLLHELVAWLASNTALSTTHDAAFVTRCQDLVPKPKKRLAKFTNFKRVNFSCCSIAHFGIKISSHQVKLKDISDDQKKDLTGSLAVVRID